MSGSVYRRRRNPPANKGFPKPTVKAIRRRRQTRSEPGIHRLSRPRSLYLGFPLGRRRLLRRGLTIAAAVSIGAVVATQSFGAQKARASWGTSREVVVAARAVAGGSVLGRGDLTKASFPDAILTPSERQMNSGPNIVEGLVGQRLRNPLERGAIVRPTDLASNSKGRVAAALESGQSAVAVKLPEFRPRIEVDDLVDVYGVVEDAEPRSEVDASAPGSPTRVPDWDRAERRAVGATERMALLAESVRVLRIEKNSVTLVVPTGRASEVIEATSRGDLNLILTG